MRKCPKPTKIKLDKKTNVETKTVTRRFNPVLLKFLEIFFLNISQETGEILFASDTKLAVDIFGKRITFEQDEVKSIKQFGSPGLKLIGFRDLKTIRPYMYVKPGHFLYPDEKVNK